MLSNSITNCPFSGHRGFATASVNPNNFVEQGGSGMRRIVSVPVQSSHVLEIKYATPRTADVTSLLERQWSHSEESFREVLMTQILMTVLQTIYGETSESGDSTGH